MGLHEDFVKIHEELHEWRSKLYNIDVSEDRHLTVLRELNKLGVSISEALKDAENVTKKIYNNASKYECGFDSSLRVGKDSVKPLVVIKHAATELFADIKDNEKLEFKEELNFEPLYNELEQLERKQAKNREFMKYLNVSVECLHEVFSDKDKGKRRLSDSETVSSSSTSRTDPSTLGFSLFENSATNAATSSPFNEN